MDSRENYLRAVRFERPEWIPMVFYISPACWRHYESSALEDLVASHPRLFDGVDPAKRPDPGAVPQPNSNRQEKLPSGFSEERAQTIRQVIPEKSPGGP